MIKAGTSSLSERCPLSAVMGLRERKKLEAWRTIRSTALALISERGFDAVSVEDIAGAAGVSRTTFFSYFPSKDDIFFALAEEFRGRFPVGHVEADVLYGMMDAAVILAEVLQSHFGHKCSPLRAGIRRGAADRCVNGET